MSLFKRKNKQTEDEFAVKCREASEKSGRPAEDIRKEAERIRREYGISIDRYFAGGFYMLPEDSLNNRANTIRVKKLFISKVAEECSWTKKKAKEEITKAKEKYGISYRDYYEKGYYLYSGEEQDAFHEQQLSSGKSPRRKKKNDPVEKLALKLGITRQEARKRLKYVEKNYGMSPEWYLSHRYYELSENAMASQFLRDSRKEAADNEIYGLIGQLSGKDRKQVLSEIKALKAMKSGVLVNLKWYFKNGAYNYDPETDREALDELFRLSKEKIKLRHELLEDFERIDRGELEYNNIEDKLKEYLALTKRTLSEARMIQLAGIAGDSVRYENDEEKADVMADIEMTDRLLGLVPSEYIAFSFQDRSIPERREYVSSRLRWKVIRLLNTEEGRELLDSKYDAYLRLKPLYKREMIMLQTGVKRSQFLDFGSRHEVFVKKNNNESLGRGVEKIETGEEHPLMTVYEELTEGSRKFVLEELIRPSEEIKKLNPDSVNTVRIIVFCDEGNAVVQDTFMKIGRKGSFVDNGGAGGIFVHVDTRTGKFDSTGIDEKAVIYETHPDHGYRFKGIRLPAWKRALETAKEASLMVPEAKYIGWDLTYTEDGDWIIVEGNSKTQFFAQQMTRGRGIRKEFLSAVHYEEIASETEDEEQDTEE